MISREKLEQLQLESQPKSPEYHIYSRALSAWWNTSWEYRVNVTVEESAGINRDNWPVDVYVAFSPPAHKYSVRVIEPTATGWREIPYQIWNIIYKNSTHIVSATLTFPVTINASGSKIYQIYWSVNYKDSPAYAKNILLDEIPISTYGTKYVIKSAGKIGVQYSAEIIPNSYPSGGTIINITLPSGVSLIQDIVHFAIAENPGLGYDQYKGTTANIINPNYDVVIEEKTDILLNLYMGGFVHRVYIFHHCDHIHELQKPRPTRPQNTRAFHKKAQARSHLKHETSFLQRIA